MPKPNDPLSRTGIKDTTGLDNPRRHDTDAPPLTADEIATTHRRIEQFLDNNTQFGQHPYREAVAFSVAIRRYQNIIDSLQRKMEGRLIAIGDKQEGRSL